MNESQIPALPALPAIPALDELPLRDLIDRFRLANEAVQTAADNPPKNRPPDLPLFSPDLTRRTGSGSPSHVITRLGEWATLPHGHAFCKGTIAHVLEAANSPTMETLDIAAEHTIMACWMSGNRRYMGGGPLPPIGSYRAWFGVVVELYPHQPRAWDVRCQIMIADESVTAESAAEEQSAAGCLCSLEANFTLRDRRDAMTSAQ